MSSKDLTYYIVSQNYYLRNNKLQGHQRYFSFNLTLRFDTKRYNCILQLLLPYQTYFHSIMPTTNQEINYFKTTQITVYFKYPPNKELKALTPYALVRSYNHGTS